MNIAVILAGGIGSRVGAVNGRGEHIPKQFVEVLGKPVLAYTIECFQNHPQIDAIEVVCIESYMDYMQEMARRYGLDKIRWIAQGGDTFQKSVMNGIEHLRDYVDRDDIVLVHFGASPFLQPEIISDCIRVAADKGNAISATDYFLLCGKKERLTSVADPENASSEWIDRDSVAVMNSPHAFRYGYVDDLYREAVETGIIDTVEPHTTTLMYKMGRKVYFALGSQMNIKITRKEDLDLFEGYVLMRQKHEQSQ